MKRARILLPPACKEEVNERIRRRTVENIARVRAGGPDAIARGRGFRTECEIFEERLALKAEPSR